MVDSTGCVPTYGRLKIDGDRLWRDLCALSEIGRASRGISRLAFSEADMEGRRWLLQRFRDAGIPARMDGYGNVFGRLTGANPGASTILIGSHIDTVPEGGMFDGALGVLAGLECLRSIKEVGLGLPHTLEAIAFANEEGSRLGHGLFGSRALFEGVPQDEWEEVYPALIRAGLEGIEAPEAGTSDVSSRDSRVTSEASAGVEAPEAGTSDVSGRDSRVTCEKPASVEAPGPVVDPKTLRAYLELHIEQGGVLHAAGEDIGVVRGIVCIHAFRASFRGEANHAGTTPMDQRKDALLGASEFILSIPEVVQRAGSGITVGTCGQVRVSPGGRNIVPGEVEISVEVRDLDESVAETVIEELRERARSVAARRGLEVALTAVARTSGAMMAPEIQEVIEQSARDLGLRARRMPSGAGHDAMILGRIVPSGMIFVPSERGISHSPEERTTKDQCADGAQVLLQTILCLSERR